MNNDSIKLTVYQRLLLFYKEKKFNTFVFDISPGKITIAVPLAKGSKQILEGFTVNDPIRIEFLTKECATIANSKILSDYYKYLNIDTDRIVSLTARSWLSKEDTTVLDIAVPVEFSKYERREFKRKQFLTECEFFVLDEATDAILHPTPDLFKGTIKSISGNGLLIEINKKLNLNDYLAMYFKNPFDNEIIEIVGKALRVSPSRAAPGSFDIALKISSIYEKDRNKIIKWIYD